MIACSWAVIETHGWVAASNAGDRTPTRDLVQLALLGHGKEAKELCQSIADKWPEGDNLTTTIISDLARHLDTNSDYEANLLTLIGRGMINPRKHLGIAVSAVPAWNRIHERETAHQLAQQAAKDRAAGQHHVGSVGDRIVMSGTLTTKRWFDGYQWNSPKQALIVIDCGDSVAKMITSARWADNVKVGDPLTVEGVVKAHDTFRDVPQTVLKRPKQIPTPPADTAWETVNPVPPQSRFQEAPLAANTPSTRSALSR